MRIREKRKISLVLSGGGIKAAAFHIGACLALQEKGLVFAGGPRDLVTQRYSPTDPFVIRSYVGSSAGSFVAALLASGYPIESLISAFQVGFGGQTSFSKNDLEYLKPFRYRNVFHINSKGVLNILPDSLFGKSLVSGGLESLLKRGLKINGLFSTAGIEKYLRKDALVFNDFHSLGVELYIVATQLNHTRKAIFGPFSEFKKDHKTKFINYAPISQAVAASTALPPVFSPYGIKNQDGKLIHYYDGEIRDTLSTHIASDHGADLVIASYSIQPYHFSTEMGSLHKYGIPVILNQALYQVIQQKIMSHRDYRLELKAIYSEVESLLKKTNLEKNQINQILEIFEKKSQYRKNVDYIYISPRPQDHEMFFADHFSLNPKILEKIVRVGFKSALHQLRHFDWK